MLLSHFTNKPLHAVHSTQQLEYAPGSYRSCYEKPLGLWVSVDGDCDWPSWCESSDYGCGVIRYRILLSSNERVLHLKSFWDLDTFTDEFGELPANESYRGRMTINWHAVAERYAGIIIAPYQWGQRMTLSWYYGWDCASGCIWDGSVIASFAPLVRAPHPVLAMTEGTA